MPSEAERAATEYADGAWLDGDGPRAWDLRKFGFQAGWLAAWELATVAERKRCAAIVRRTASRYIGETEGCPVEVSADCIALEIEAADYRIGIDLARPGTDETVTVEIEQQESSDV